MERSISEHKKEEIEKSFQKILKGKTLSEYDIECMLSSEVDEEKIHILGKKARRIAEEVTGNQGKIWASIGLDYTHCSMNCSFCSMGSSWNPCNQVEELSEEEVKEIAEHYVREGIDWLVLRTTEFYEIDRLLQRIKMIKSKVKGNYILMVNTGDANSRQVEALKAAGADMVYQAVRLREGIDTGFVCREREETIETIVGSKLRLAQYLEPVGPEHTDRELAKRMMDLIRQGTFVGGVMERVPVKGTPKYELGTMLPDRMARITALLRIASQESIQDIIIHPYHRQCVDWGANGLVVDMGAIPRKRGMSREVWRKQDVFTARQRLKSGEYQLDVKF